MILYPLVLLSTHTRRQHRQQHATALWVTPSCDAYAVRFEQLGVITLHLGKHCLAQHNHIIHAEQKLDDDLITERMHAGIGNNRLVRFYDTLLVLRVTTISCSCLVAAVIQRLHCELHSQSSGGEGRECVIQLIHQHHDALRSMLPNTPYLRICNLDIVIKDFVCVGVVQQAFVDLRVVTPLYAYQLGNHDEQITNELFLQQRVLRSNLHDAGGLRVLHVDELAVV